MPPHLLIGATMKQGKAGKTRLRKAIAPKRRRAQRAKRSRAGNASAADLRRQLDGRTRELREALEQQATTSEILKVISRSTFDLQPMLDSLVEKAVRVCGAERGLIYRQDGDVYRVAASYGHSDEFLEKSSDETQFPRIAPLRQDGPLWSAASYTFTIFSLTLSITGQRTTVVMKGMHRTILAMPMLREDKIIGVIAISMGSRPTLL